MCGLSAQQLLASALCSWLKQRPCAQATAGGKSGETSDDPQEQRISLGRQHAHAPLHREGSVTAPPLQRCDGCTVLAQDSPGSLDPQRLRGSLNSRRQRQQQQRPESRAVALKRWQQQPHPHSLHPQAADANKGQLQKLPPWTLVSLHPPLSPQMLLPPLPRAGCALRTRSHPPLRSSVRLLGQQPRPRRPPPSRQGGRAPRPPSPPRLSPSPSLTLSQQPLQDRIASRAATASAAVSPRHSLESKRRQVAAAGAVAVTPSRAAQHAEELPDQVVSGLTRAGPRLNPMRTPDVGATMASFDGQTQSVASAAVAALPASASAVVAPAQLGSLPAEVEPVAEASGGAAVSGRVCGSLQPRLAAASGAETAGPAADEQVQALDAAVQAVAEDQAAEGSVLRGSGFQRVKDDPSAPACPVPDRSPGFRLHCSGPLVEEPETAPGKPPSSRAQHHAATRGVVERGEALNGDLDGVNSMAPRQSPQRPSPPPPLPLQKQQLQRARPSPPLQRPRPAALPLAGSRVRVAAPAQARSRTLFIERPSGHLAARLWMADDRCAGNLQLPITGCRTQT